jgi:RNA polymerase sigma-70 factor (ECF subfamily)
MTQSYQAMLRQPVLKPLVAHGHAVSSTESLAARDLELVARIRAGDKRAEETLYRIHVRAVSDLATRLLGRSHDAEDVVQDAFLTALARLSQLRDGAFFRAWLLRITVHEVHRRFRRRRLLSALGMDSGHDDATLAALAMPTLGADLRAELAALDRALLQLPPKERVAWMLRHVEGQELTEVASACDTSLATIKRWLGRAEAHVRTHVALSHDHD